MSKRWKPKEGGKYWIITWDGSKAVSLTSDEVQYLKPLYRLGNCFRTKAEAQKAARGLKAFWKSVRKGER